MVEQAPYSPKNGMPEIAQAKAGADALVEQVAREDILYVRRGELRLLQQLVDGFLLHFALGLLPGRLAELVVVELNVKTAAERTFRLLAAAERGRGEDIRAVFEKDGMRSDSAH